MEWGEVTADWRKRQNFCDRKRCIKRLNSLSVKRKRLVILFADIVIGVISW